MLVAQRAYILVQLDCAETTVNNLLDDPTVAKKKPEPAATPEPDVSAQSSTRINREVLRKANIVARVRGVSLYDYLHLIVTPQVENDFDGLNLPRKPGTQGGAS